MIPPPWGARFEEIEGATYCIGQDVRAWAWGDCDTARATAVSTWARLVGHEHALLYYHPEEGWVLIAEDGTRRTLPRS